MTKKDNDLIKQTRVSIMGIAALWIMLFHSTIEMPIKPIAFINEIGYLGVDIFMFMSGFSMYNSFNKTCNCNWKVFIKKRVARIVPTFVPFAILWWVGYIWKNYPTQELLLQAIHTKTFWITMAIFRWFVPCICFCYLITPLISYVFNKMGYTYKNLIVLTGSIIAVSFAFWGSSVALMFILRIPEYIIGYYYGEDKQRSSKIVYRIGILCLGGMIYVGLLNNFSDLSLSDYGLYWYPAILLTSSIVICLSKFLIKVKSKMVIFVGKISLEVYLWHFYLLFPLIEFVEKKNIKLDKYNIIINLFAIILTLVIADLYSKIINKVVIEYKELILERRKE